MSTGWTAVRCCAVAHWHGRASRLTSGGRPVTWWPTEAVLQRVTDRVAWFRRVPLESYAPADPGARIMASGHRRMAQPAAKDDNSRRHAAPTGGPPADTDRQSVRHHHHHCRAALHGRLDAETTAISPAAVHVSRCRRHGVVRAGSGPAEMPLWELGLAALTRSDDDGVEQHSAGGDRHQVHHRRGERDGDAPEDDHQQQNSRKLRNTTAPMNTGSGAACA
jgi:hypothetical protein